MAYELKSHHQVFRYLPPIRGESHRFATLQLAGRVMHEPRNTAAR